ncbi:LuxR C-terminal-related transcriptional regulator [Nocardia sp. NPDC005825]|uniref:response regulator transcription factor n=1 Tax=unclassified Nocardia TaxID=2637762 RepID=UPI0033CDB582
MTTVSFATHSNHSATLTRRERGIVALAAQGMSNRDIAERLFISIRTVENHLQRSYHKLGIHSRHELCDAAERMRAAV